MADFKELLINKDKCKFIVAQYHNKISNQVIRFIGVYDDWHQAKEFTIDTKEQIDELINMLNKLKERWS